MKASNVHANQLLGAFNKEFYDRTMPHMTEVGLKLAATICEAVGYCPPLCQRSCPSLHFSSILEVCGIGQ